MNGRSIRNKGLSFERQVANLLKEVGFPLARRNLEDIRECKKIDLSGTEPFAIQCKRGRQYAPMKVLETIVAGDSHIPVLVTKADNQPIVAALYFADLLQLIRRGGDCGQERK